MAEPLVDEAEVIQGARLAFQVAQFAVQAQRLAGGAERLGVLAELDLAPADAVEGQRLPGAVAGGFEQRQGGAGARHGLPGLPLALEYPAEAEVQPRLVDGVAELPEQAKALVESARCLLVLAGQ